MTGVGRQYDIRLLASIGRVYQREKISYMICGNGLQTSTATAGACYRGFMCEIGPNATVDIESRYFSFWDAITCYNVFNFITLQPYNSSPRMVIV